MRVYFGQGAQVSAGVYGGGVAASAAYAGAVQVHPEGEEGPETLDVLATTTGSAQAYRLLKWWHETRLFGGEPEFRVPYEGGLGAMWFTATEFELVAVTPTMVYIRLTLNFPEGATMEDVRSALEAGRCVEFRFRGAQAWSVSHAVDMSKQEWTHEFDGPLFLGSGKSNGSKLTLNAPGVSRVRSMLAQVEFNGKTVLAVKATNGSESIWWDSGAVQNLTVETSEQVFDIGHVRISIKAYTFSHFTGAKHFTPGFSMCCFSQMGTHRVPLELA